MKWHLTILMTGGLLAATVALTLAAPHKPHKKTPAAPAPPLPKLNYQVVNEWKIGGVGEWSSVTLDAAGKHLYIPRQRHTDVVDTATGKVAEIPTGHAESVVLVPDVNRGFITNYEQGTVTVFDLKTNAVLGDFAVGAQASDMIYDPASKRLLIRCASSTLVPLAPDVNLKTGKPDPPITFDGNIGGLIADDRGMVYVTLVDRHEVAVLDTRTMTIATHWSIGTWQRPQGIAMDRLHSRLFVCNEDKLTILSASDGHIISDLTIGQTAPNAAAFYDGHVFVACNKGTLAIVGQKPDGDFFVENTIKDEPHSQPIALDQNTGKIYLPTQQIVKWQPVPNTFKVLTLQKK